MLNSQLTRLKYILTVLVIISLCTLLLSMVNQDSLHQIYRLNPLRHNPSMNVSLTLINSTNHNTPTKIPLRSSSPGGTQQPTKKTHAKEQTTKKPAVKSKPKKVWKELPILTPQFNGRLGNHMFTYAVTYALAVSKNMSVYLAKNDHLNRLFNLDKNVVTDQGCGGWHSVSSSCCDYDPSLEQRIDQNKCQVVGNYLQSWKYFSKVDDHIRKQFTFQPGIAKSAHDKLSFIKQTYQSLKYKNQQNVSATTSTIVESSLNKEKDGNFTFIGIHARRGDYLSTTSVRQGRVTPSADYYIRAMDYFRKIYSNVVFIAASDSLPWVNKEIKKPDVVVLERNSPEADLCLLSMCNHTIISVGTFSWWAGFLSGGTTVYYSKRFPNNTAMARFFKHFETDYIYKGWIGMQ